MSVGCLSSFKWRSSWVIGMISDILKLKSECLEIMSKGPNSTLCDSSFSRSSVAALWQEAKHYLVTEKGGGLLGSLLGLHC